MPASVPPGFYNINTRNPTAAPVRPKFGGGGAWSAAVGRGGQAATVAQKAVKAAGGRSTVKTAAPKAAPPAISNVAGAPPTAPLAPEDAALQGQYPTDLNINQNTKLNGLAGTVQLPNALNYAHAMGQMQYGPQIQATAGRIKGLIAALPGALDSLNKAFANVDALNTHRNLQSAATSGQGVASLFSGTGATGAGGAAAVAANDAVQANATAANLTGAQSDQAGADARRQADWTTRIQLLNNMAVNQGRSDLAGLQGAKGAAEKGFYDQGLKMRGDMISQDIGNQGALQNQKIAAALASGQIEGMKLSNEQKQLLVKTMGINASYLPSQLQTGIQGSKQNILNSQISNDINVTTAKAQLKALSAKTAGGVTSLAAAKKAGGFGALAAMILPQGAYGTDATTGRPKVFGDLNTYFNNGVSTIMSNLPGSDRKAVKQYVANELNKVASATNQWVFKNGRYHKVK